MAKRTCEICGKPTEEADFSKSYKHRCKECVARISREARASAKPTTESNPEYISIPGSILDDQPNWEQRRYDVALTVFLNELNRNVMPYAAAKYAREAADKFINEIRGYDNEQTSPAGSIPTPE